MANPQQTPVGGGGSNALEQQVFSRIRTLARASPMGVDPFYETWLSILDQVDPQSIKTFTGCLLTLEHGKIVTNANVNAGTTGTRY